MADQTRFCPGCVEINQRLDRTHAHLDELEVILQRLRKFAGEKGCVNHPVSVSLAQWIVAARAAADPDSPDRLAQEGHDAR